MGRLEHTLDGLSVMVQLLLVVLVYVGEWNLPLLELLIGKLRRFGQ